MNINVGWDTPYVFIQITIDPETNNKTKKLKLTAYNLLRQTCNQLQLFI